MTDPSYRSRTFPRQHAKYIYIYIYIYHIVVILSWRSFGRYWCAVVLQNRTLEHAHLLNHEDSFPGLEINEKMQSQFCEIQKFSRNTSPQYLSVKKPLKRANDRKKGAVHVTSQLKYPTIELSSEEIHHEKQNNFVISFIYFSKSSNKVATANPFVPKERR